MSDYKFFLWQGAQRPALPVSQEEAMKLIPECKVSPIITGAETTVILTPKRFLS